MHSECDGWRWDPSWSYRQLNYAVSLLWRIRHKNVIPSNSSCNMQHAVFVQVPVVATRQAWWALTTETEANRTCYNCTLVRTINIHVLEWRWSGYYSPAISHYGRPGTNSMLWIAGAFIIPYFIMLLIIALPVFFMELCWGQFASLGPIAIWNMNPLMKGTVYRSYIHCKDYNTDLATPRIKAE